MSNQDNKISEFSYTTKVWINISILAFTIVVLLILEATFNVFLLIFAGILIAVFFRGLSGLIERKTNWNEKVCFSLAILVTLILTAGFFWLVGAKIQMQVAELSETLPKTIENARTQLSKSPIGEKVLERITSEESAMKLQGSAATFFKSTFGVFGDLYVVLFIGIFLTVSPKIYINAIVELVPLSGQGEAKHILKLLGLQLRKWIKGKLLSMFVVFVLTAIGLAILGIPLWLVLALLAGLLSFIPNFGPILALLPAALVGLMQGPQTALWIVGLYILIQFIESNFITTLTQQKMVNIPPALIISAQMILGALTGSWGLVLSTPLTVVIIVLIKQLYIEKEIKSNPLPANGNINANLMRYPIKAIPLLFFCCFLCQITIAKGMYQQDSILTDTGEVTGLHTSERSIDSLIQVQQLESNTADQVMRFYKTRDYQYAWITEEGLAEHTQIFWNVYDLYQYYSGDSTFNDHSLQEQMELLQNEEGDFNINLQDLDFKFTSFFLRFFKRAYKGRVDPAELQWHIPRKKLDVVDLLEELVYTDTTQLKNWLPISSHYNAMKKKVLYFKSLQQHDWPVFSLGTRQLLKPGDTAHVIKDFKHRLSILGDLEAMDTTSAYNEKFTSAVIAFQRRHGLNDDGIIGPAFMSAINTPLGKKIEQMLINMERMRWMPNPEAGKRVEVNIPEFRLHVYKGNKDILSMDVVVGKAANKTVIFSDRIKHVVFSPYWNLPQSIVRNEVLPGLKRDSAYLIRRHMEITGERNGLPVIRQKPGPNNALGRVKFIFPNKYLIYLHDTPAKQLFQRTTRAFSHGCIRLADPFALAANLLVNRTQWPLEKIKTAMAADRELWVNIKEPVPVYITYFTSWVDASGKLNFRKDIYGHDERLASHLINTN